MKKFLAAVAMVGAFAGQILAATTDSILIRVTPTPTKDVTINSPAEIDFGAVAVGVGQSTISTVGIDVENSGTGLQTYALNLDLLGGSGTAWTSSDTVGTDQFAMYAIFNGGSQPAPAEFDTTAGTGDFVVAGSRTSTVTVYSDGTETGVGVSPIPAFDNRTLWLRLDMPTLSTSTNLEEQFNLVVTAL